jgi:tRNA-2-methylthio-N6-dimethylallyladenosine synthase
MLYDDNPTLVGLKKEIDESKQGEVLFNESIQIKEGKKFYIESYGCAMNFADSEVVASILNKEGYSATRDILESDLILINTCSIREKAEDTVRKRLEFFKSLRKQKKNFALVGVLGCMAERLKTKFLEDEKLVDMVVGPDSYRDLPNLIHNAEDGEKGINVFLSREETYADINPVRLDSNGVTAFVSIMRGCDNMCSFCVVPFTRGRERSRDLFSILAEIQSLFNEGYREVTLLGQNVDSYNWENPENNQSFNFANLLAECAKINTKLRIRFSTSHPKDITDEVLHTINAFDNICKHIHLPVQSGNSRILKLMNRTYDRKWYMNKIESIYSIIPNCTISSDIIAGFCTETEEEHQDTISIVKYSKFIMSYMYIYSERPGTLAARKYEDDIPESIKQKRLQEIIDVQRAISYDLNQNELGNIYEVLIEGNSKKSNTQYKGRNSNSKMIVFEQKDGVSKGDYVYVKVIGVTSGTLLGEIVD